MGFKEVFAVVFESEGLEELINDLNTARDAVRETQREIDNLGKNRSAEKPTRVVPVHPVAPQKQTSTPQNNDSLPDGGKSRVKEKEQKKTAKMQQNAASQVVKGLVGFHAFFKSMEYLFQSMEKAMQEGARLGATSGVLAMSPQQLKALETLASTNGASASDMTSFLMRQQELAGRARMGDPEGLIKQIEKSGVKITDGKGNLLNGTQLLRSFAQWAEGQSDKAKILAAGGEMGLSPALVNFLSKGVKNFDEKFEEAYKLTPDAKTLEKFEATNKELQAIKTGVEKSIMNVLNEMLPVIRGISSAVAALNDENSELFKLFKDLFLWIIDPTAWIKEKINGREITKEEVRNTPKGFNRYVDNPFLNANLNEFFTIGPMQYAFKRLMEQSKYLYNSLKGLPINFKSSSAPYWEDKSFQKTVAPNQPSGGISFNGDIVVNTTSDDPHAIGDGVKGAFNGLLQKYPNTIKQ